MDELDDHAKRLWKEVLSVLRQNAGGDNEQAVTDLLLRQKTATVLALTDWVEETSWAVRNEEAPVPDGVSEDALEEIDLALSFSVSPLNPHPQSGEGIHAAMWFLEENYGQGVAGMFADAIDEMPLIVALHLVSNYEQASKRMSNPD